MKKIYIINGVARGAQYGIGTYNEQLIYCLKKMQVSFEVFQLFSEEEEIIIEEKEYRKVSIPGNINFDNKSLKHYSRNVAYLLTEFICPNESCIFHINFLNKPDLVINLKRIFKNSSILIIVHYTNWSFSLLGDYSRLNVLLQKRTKLNDFENQILQELRNDQKMLNECDKFVCVAQHTLNCFSKIGNIDMSKGIVIPNALKDIHKEISIEKKQRLKDKYLIPATAKIIVFAGRLDEVKGVSFLIRAFRNVLKSNPNTILFIAGQGDFNSLMKGSNGIWRQVLFTGILGKKDLFELYSIADVGVVSSLHEEFGYVAIEMLMHSLPIIVSDTGGLAEIIEDNISGLKVPIKMIGGKRTIHINKLSHKIKLLLDVPNYAFQIGSNGRKRFLQKYEMLVFKKNMLDLYRSI